ncbi:methyltransferase domain-containing protein [Pseudodesulfovibrio cashew]|uniref:Methyltransferase domain-containing protein n=1 Tax=Pseudodesulfovibrio cashew TaxID=2678688 RepID=A0A6I6JP25_9BACT|nr:class I SAM-dependent methyltransferase [Pseudodesulfovibrio cashew]QGY39374.1 methyltransferase domain-containing protein [Pseudodesulfovibrio cashew]
MSHELWMEVMDGLADRSLVLSKYFSHQVLENPRHLLFTLSRYKAAAKMLPRYRECSVLELGCNEGVASLILAENATAFTGVDFDADGIAWAKENLAGDKLSFVADDFLGKTYGSFDAVVSLDVIEHIAPEEEGRFIDTVLANLAKDGICVLGTPNDTASQYASAESQKGHINMYTAERLYKAAAERFANVFFFGMNDEVLHTGFDPMCHYLMVLACNPK